MSANWKQVLGTVAPALATALGGPLAGVATQALSGALLGRADGTEEDVATAVLTGGTEALAKLRDADNQFAVRMRELEIDLERVHQADRASARDREKTTGDHWTLRVLATIVVGAFVAVVWAVLFGGTAIDGALAGTLIGYLSAKADQVLSYFFGSSLGSKEKTAALTKVAR